MDQAHNGIATMADKIHINTVLADLQSAEGRSARITIVKSTGKNRGMHRSFDVVHAFAYESFKKRTHIEHIRAREESTSSKYAKLGLIPLVDTKTDTQLTLLISHIVGYEGKKVIH